MTNNPQLQNAALTGIISGVQRRWITSSVSGSYQALVSTASLIASLVDASIPTYAATFSDIHLMKCMCEGIFASRDIIGSGDVNIHEPIVQLWSQLRAKFSATNNLNSDQFINRSVIAGLTLTEALDNVPSFVPTDVPEILAGYWWDSELYSNLGLSTFAWTEQNLVTGFNQTQTAVANQPEPISENGYGQLHYRSSAAPSSSFTRTTGAPIAGWAGATYAGYWLRHPIGITGSNTHFRHQGTAGTRRFLTTRNTTQVSCALSTDGTNQFTYRWNASAADEDWHFYEFDYLPSEAVATRCKFALDGVLISPAATAAPGTALYNLGAIMTLASSIGIANPDDTDIGMCYYGNGTPSPANKALLRRYKAPIIIP